MTRRFSFMKDSVDFTVDCEPWRCATSCTIDSHFICVLKPLALRLMDCFLWNRLSIDLENTEIYMNMYIVFLWQQCVVKASHNWLYFVYFQVIDVHDCKSIYRVPLLLSSQGIVPLFSKRLKMEIKSPKPRHFMMQWRELAERYSWAAKATCDKCCSYMYTVSCTSVELFQ